MRILDAAADLLQRHGYHRVTVDDVAQRAQVGKGTVYLHWRTRQELFSAVLVRDVSAAFDEVADAVDRDVQAWRISHMARAFYLSIMQRPLLMALVRSDPEVLGRLSGGGLGERYGRRVTLLDAYVHTLAGLGLLRDDLPVEDVSLAFRATVEGFLLIDLVENAAPIDRPPPRADRLADLLALTTQAAFESRRTVPDDVRESLRRKLSEQLRAVAAADRAGLGIGAAPGPSLQSPDRSTV
jgi:AcrR family transcriptional regulator